MLDAICRDFFRRRASTFRAQFDEQLGRLKTDYVDFYMLHGVTDALMDDYLNQGAPEYFDAQKEKGHIGRFGFSFHGSTQALRDLLDRRAWDFVQIQLNYYDWFFGEAREQYGLLLERSIPIMVMEPTHGGMLANLPEDVGVRLKAAHPNRSYA